ncbi:MAG: NADH:ubiquinone reductase (Na(+)-transporting) subunit A, partial [Planctomycetota bacterium]
MRRVRIRKGLDLDVPGRPERAITPGRPVRSVAVLGSDHPAFGARLRVEAGDRVREGDVLFEHRRIPALVVTSPGCGVVSHIERGARRALVSIVVELDGDEAVRFPVHDAGALDRLEREAIVDTLLRSGLWTALRARPFGRVPSPDDALHALFVTALDTRPLAPDLEAIVDSAGDAFHAGLAVLRRLTPESIYLCRAPGSSVSPGDVPGIQVAEFAGPHPAGLPGTHIHHLARVDAGRSAWHVGAQDVIAVGRLFLTGRPDVERVVALGGPAVCRPRLVRTRLGAALTDLLHGELDDGPTRVVSGSVLHGHHAEGPRAFLGRYDEQVAALPERPARRRATTTAQHGRRTTMVPVEAFERVLPFDTLAVPLLRSLLVGDVESARALGCAELVEEDLALCTYVCPGKQ